MPTVTLADCCARAGVKHFIYTSSAAANDFTYKTEEARIGGIRKYNVFENTKQNPASYYGATKASTENYLNAISYVTDMKVNIVNTGFTYGNPAVEGGPIYSDKRFNEIINNALNGSDIKVVKNDRNPVYQCNDLAEIYIRILKQGVNRTMYFGLSKNYISWEFIAKETLKICNSHSKIIVEDRGWGDPIMFDVAAIKRDFNLEFDGWIKLSNHIIYLKSCLQK